MKIIYYPDPQLLQKSKRINKFDWRFKAFSLSLQKCMLDNGGIGISAVQVGHPIRLMIIKPNLFIVNPKVLYRSSEQVLMTEGCLSFPGEFIKVLRPDKVKIEYQDLFGVVKERELTDLNARVFLHELDHFEGILFNEYDEE